MLVALRAGVARSSSAPSSDSCLRRRSSMFASCIASHSFASDMICRERSSTAGSALSSSRLPIVSSLCKGSPWRGSAGRFDRFLPQPTNREFILFVVIYFV